MNSAYDVIVVGGGPGGALCALDLARGGARVALIEKARPPRYKTCGGGLVLRARNRLPFEPGALDGAIERECHTAELFFGDDETAFQVTREQPLVTLAMRAELDEFLLERARDAGAELHFHVELLNLKAQPDEVVLTTSAGPLRARFVVGADGALGPTAKLAGWSHAPRSIPALESEVAVDDATLARYAESARFDFGVIEAGYAWVFPKRAHLSVGVLSTRRGASNLKARLAAYLERLGIVPRDRADHGFVIPVAPRPGGFARERVLLIGDAAGLADPVLCEGISHAILSGQLAARALLPNLDDPSGVRATYRKLLRREILGELFVARRLAGLLYGHPRFTQGMFRRLGPSLCEGMAQVVAGERGYRDLVGSTSSYLRLLRPTAKRS